MNSYLVGGAVRDLLLVDSFVSNDFDFVIEGDARIIAREFQIKYEGDLEVFDSFLTAKILNCKKFNNIREIDFASARKESYAKGGALPKVGSSSIKEDLSRRDFSINAMAILVSDLLKCISDGKLEKEKLIQYVIDKFDGINDLRARKISVLHDKSFIDDPTRIFRAFRYKARIDGSFDEKTEELIREAIKLNVFQTISEGRKKKEILKIRHEDKAKNILDEMKDYKILEIKDDYGI